MWSISWMLVFLNIMGILIHLLTLNPDRAYINIVGVAVAMIAVKVVGKPNFVPPPPY